MNTTAYSQSEFEARQAQRAEQMQAALAADAPYQNAVKSLEKAKGDLEHLQTFISNQRTLERRLQYNQNLTEAKANVTQAEAAALQARNAVYRQGHLARLEEQKQARNQAQVEQQKKLASEAEAEAKQQYRAVWQGTPEQLEQVWPEMWQRELQARAVANVAATQHYMGQRYAL